MSLSKKTKIFTVFALTGSILGSTLTLPAIQTVFAAENEYQFLTENDLRNGVKQAIPSFLDKNKPYGMYVEYNGSKWKRVIDPKELDQWYQYPQLVNAVKDIFRASYTNYVGLKDLTIENQDSKITSLRKVGEPELIQIGTSELVNTDSETKQNLTSAPFSKAFTSTSTVTVTKGVNLGFKVGSKIGIPLVGADISTEFSHNTNWSTNHTTTSTSTDTYTAPAQTISVPPRTKAIVTYVLSKQQYEGEIALKGDLTGSMFLYDPYIVAYPGMSEQQRLLYTSTLYNLFDKSGVQLPTGLALDRGNQKIKFNGTAKLKVYGGQMHDVVLKIVSLDDPNKVIEERKISTKD